MVTTRATLALIAVIACGSHAVRAQQTVGDSLWRLGNRNEALDAYRRVIAADPNAVRANFRIAQELAGRSVDSALVFLRNARTRVPDDPDLMFTEATYLSWVRRFDEAVARYDSLLAAHPDLDYVRVARARVLSWKGDLASAAGGYAQVVDGAGVDADARRDAAFGLAQVAAWQGNFAESAERYASLLSDDPTEARTLIGLAAVRSWQDRPFAARALLDRALARDSANADARKLLVAVERARSPTLEVTGAWSHDSDDNSVAWQTATQTFVVGDGARVWAVAGSQQADDPARRTTRLLGEVGGTTSRGIAQVTASIGARRLNVAAAPNGAVGDRTEFTWRASASLRPHANVAFGVGMSHAPFDEIAALLARGINLTNVEATADWSPRAGTSVVLNGGVLNFSDGNRRTGALVRLSHQLRGAFTLGSVARTFSFQHKGDGYFTPDQFVLADVYGGWERGFRRWSIGLSGGGGIQRLGPHDPTQGQWHVDARIARRFDTGGSIDVFGGTSTSAAASAVGAFRYETAGVTVRIPF